MVNNLVGSHAKSLAQSFYADTAPTDSTIFEASPLNRPMASFGAGQAWRAANKKTQIFYESGGTEVRYYTVNASNNIVLNGSYPAHSLFKKRVLDEQGNETIAYTDKRGRMIEKRQQLQTGVYAHTHYLYDGLGRPKAIIQPMGYDLNLGFTYNSADFQKWVFFYNYDTRGRNTEKHVPAAGFTKMIYDKKDRLVMQQDAFQATLNKWNFQKYDAFDREVFRGETLNANAQSVLQSAFNVYTAPDEVWNSGSGYSGTSFPAMVNPSINDVQLFTFYDQYDFVSALNNNLAFEGGSAFHAKHTSAKGLQTGTVAYNQADHNQFFISAQYFDTKNRSIQAKTQNHLGGIDLVNTKYGFAGQVLQNNLTHRKAGQADISNQTQTDYDPMLRPTQLRHSINGQAFKVLANYSYDDLGRLNRKIIEPGAVDYTCGNSKESMTSGSWTQPSTWQGSSVPTVGDAVKINVGHTVNLFNQQSQDIMYVITYGGLNISGAGTKLNLKFVGNNTTNLSTALQTIDYAYHIRGWLKGVNPSLNTAEGDLLSYKLDYETAGYYDGNIGKITWQSPDNPYSCAKPTRSYTYSYDKSSRLLNATYASNVSNENFGIAGMSYDKNGNINTLQRYGINGSAFGLIDNLSYFYSGNRLTGVSDAVSGNPNVGDFRASGNSSNYTYYPNGSLKSDANKGISLIEYNTYLNKVKQVTWSDGRWLKFNYDGAGSLLKKENSAGEYWDYVGDLIYKNGNNYSLNNAEGRIVFTSNSWNYEYDYRDIWGNLRLSFASENGQLKVKQQSDFDPFGYIFNQSASVNKNLFQYQKQQRIEDFNLNIDFFKFRPSDPTIGRFWMVDPLSSDYAYNSVYALQENKFGMGVELEGAELKEFGEWLGKKVDQVLSWTDVDDVTVVVTNLTRGGNAVHIDGQPATGSDKVFAAGGLLLPAASGAAVKKIINAVTNIKANQAAGAAREVAEHADLVKNNPGSSVQNQQYLRTPDGKIAKDPITGEGRRIDHVVIENGKAKDVVETTSKTANKIKQFDKEERIRDNGGTFVRDRITRELVNIKEISTRTSRRE
ncbi:RHS repeat domain-containing protein [Lacihabitans lacunae]|uniref:RHS repeat domain-containing protein n=1 Tax=Lacihabitans lacunae TaxID=1028214 RepID=A0ABV7Z557_9BACT